MTLEKRIRTHGKIPAGKKAHILLIMAGTVVQDEMRALLKTFGLSLPQFNVLRILRGQDGKPANLKTIQKRMVHQSSNTTRIIDKLTEKDFVLRRVCPDNRRKIQLEITRAGLDLLEKIDPEVEQLEQKTQNVLSEKEVSELNCILEKLIHNY